VTYDGKEIGFMGQVLYEIADELDARVPMYVAQIDVKALEGVFGKKRVFVPLPKFAVEKRDLALVMDKTVTAGAVEDVIKASSAYVTEVSLFDIYEGAQLPAGKKSLAYSVVFTPADTEFTDEIIEGEVKKILDALKEKLDIVLRS
ncbi:MAG: phenylalanine--tRNA ligase subunit beta, partial [Lachnospiraceae bacterium]|nr:phenylalanine--tRNA ligase subunit beta [Lachnospiraceae bacterium]